MQRVPSNSRRRANARVSTVRLGRASAGCAMALAVLDGQMAETDALDLVGASIEVVPVGIAFFHSSRDHRLVDRMRLKL